jgi:hypothetical protein
MFDNHTSDIGSPDARYDIAFKRVKGLRGSIFIIGLRISKCLVNHLKFIHTQHADRTIFLMAFSTAFFWELVLAWFICFGRNIFWI